MDNEKNTLKDYFKFGEVIGYFFRKKDPNQKTGFTLKAMHTINKISILIFLLALIVWIVRRVL